MCSNTVRITGHSSNTSCDGVELQERFSEEMARLCMSDDYSDVVFLVEDQRLSAHRVILAARSEYFRALLFGGLLESRQNEIELKVPIDAFRALLKYIYSGLLPLRSMNENVILDVLGLSHQYGLTDLENAISNFFHLNLSLKNVCAVMDKAILYGMKDLEKVCSIYFDRNAVEVLQHETFCNLSRDSLEEILGRDSFYAPEVQIFLAVAEWCKQNRAADIAAVVSLVRLPLISLEHILQVVRPSGILSPDKLLDAIEDHLISKKLPHRGALWPEENVATERHLARTIQGELRASLLDGDTNTYDMERGYTRHFITDSNESGIVVELGSVCIINYVKILLWDRDNRSYSYIVQVSVDQKFWDHVVEYSDYHCRSWQYLYFKARPVRYIRLVGTHNTVNKVFHVVALEAKYTANNPNRMGDIIIPTMNVASIQMNAIVVEGVSRTRNALINGDFINYDWDTGYTCHQLGNGEIVVRLNQPYILESMRFLLWDCDDRNYSYYVEVSNNQKDWYLIADKRNELASSWQNISFKPRPVVYIRIVGTRNTANEIFHIVHLECPSQDEVFLQQEREKKISTTEDFNDVADLFDEHNDLSSASSSGASNASSQSNLSVISNIQQITEVIEEVLEERDEENQLQNLF